MFRRVNAGRVGVAFGQIQD